MGVPVKLKSKAHVYRYSSDLETACTTLQGRLSSGCKYTKITCKKGYASAITGDELFCSGDKVAWLVGHGDKGNLRIGTKTHSAYLDFTTIMDYLVRKGFKVVVDTCCEPQTRKSEFKKTYKGQVRYFCAPDTHTVTCNEDHLSLDDWWDHNQMAEVT